MPLTTLLLIHAAATWFMVGLIWLVQAVHYPLFAAVGPEGFRAYEAGHVRRITPVVGPAMLVEAVSAGWLLVRPDADRALAAAGCALVVVCWLSTALLQVPQHRVLEKGYDERAVRALVRTNWVRTVAWTARGVIAAAMLA